MHHVFLGIGGNLGNKQDNLTKVLLIIENKLGAIVKKSSVYETPPWGFDAEENFWNIVVQIKTELAPEELLLSIKTIEKGFGRKPRKENYTSREMDIDILYYDNMVVDTEQLKIPHPHIPERLFVLVPLVEIAPGFSHPVLKKSSVRLLENCKDASKITRIEL
ncbi:2-amino-4-hydroxy-6-hydroxymethyldihydropteridinediphosphokinase [Mariniphaga anaerophila]|uniref:2-amino-4-hydroxy-6-hydroxymethyldihydropteridine pyrophosphokinase n=1 Tax=Mariniphaga anaerophila TaxID=1484053 RepID=A0A1M5CAD6_9BACT|nr:2-amino-4-hydroxy-6-hydroxymethyldihydropteridine diphosphokinase [Mariniphaga anaerophila]SHF51705.1 2-amino-4-hydroxy-6-hydroxymethyldihydropteridinediphosphokinase [Mariniphaga anaerophila]